MLSTEITGTVCRQLEGLAARSTFVPNVLCQIHSSKVAKFTETESRLQRKRVHAADANLPIQPLKDSLILIQRT